MNKKSRRNLLGGFGKQIKRFKLHKHNKQWLVIGTSLLLMAGMIAPTATGVAKASSTTPAHEEVSMNLASEQADPSNDFFNNFGNQIQSGFNNPSDYTKFMHTFKDEAPDTINGAKGSTWAQYFSNLKSDASNTNGSSSTLSNLMGNIDMAISMFGSRANNVYTAQTLESKVQEYTDPLGIFGLNPSQADSINAFLQGLNSHQVYMNQEKAIRAQEQREHQAQSASASVAHEHAMQASLASLNASKASSASRKASASIAVSNAMKKASSENAVKSASIAKRQASSVASHVASKASHKASTESKSVKPSSSAKESTVSSKASSVASKATHKSIKSKAVSSASTKASSAKVSSASRAQSIAPRSTQASSASSATTQNVDPFLLLSEFNTSSASSASANHAVKSSATSKSAKVSKPRSTRVNKKVNRKVRSKVNRKALAKKRAIQRIKNRKAKVRAKRRAIRLHKEVQRKRALRKYLHKHYITLKKSKHAHVITVKRGCHLYRINKHGKKYSVGYLRRGESLRVRKIFRYGHTMKLKVSKNTFITANKKFVKVIK